MIASGREALPLPQPRRARRTAATRPTGWSAAPGMLMARPPQPGLPPGHPAENMRELAELAVERVGLLVGAVHSAGEIAWQPISDLHSEPLSEVTNNPWPGGCASASVAPG